MRGSGNAPPCSCRPCLAGAFPTAHLYLSLLTYHSPHPLSSPPLTRTRYTQDKRKTLLRTSLAHTHARAKRAPNTLAHIKSVPWYIYHVTIYAPTAPHKFSKASALVYLQGVCKSLISLWSWVTSIYKSSNILLLLYDADFVF